MEAYRESRSSEICEVQPHSKLLFARNETADWRTPRVGLGLSLIAKTRETERKRWRQRSGQRESLDKLKRGLLLVDQIVRDGRVTRLT